MNRIESNRESMPHSKPDWPHFLLALFWATLEVTTKLHEQGKQRWREGGEAESATSAGEVVEQLEA